MSLRRCRVSQCRNDAIPGTDYCRKHSPPEKKGGRPGYPVEWQEALDISHSTKATEIIRELAKINASIEEIESTITVLDRKATQLSKEMGKKTGMEYDDLRQELRETRTALKGLRDVKKKKEQTRKDEYFGQTKKEEWEREQAVLPEQKPIDETRWYDDGDTEASKIIKAEQEKKKKKYEEYQKEERKRRYKDWKY